MSIEPHPASPDQPSTVRQVEGSLIGSRIVIMIGIGSSLNSRYAHTAPCFAANVILLVRAVLAGVGGFNAYRLLRDRA